MREFHQAQYISAEERTRAIRQFIRLFASRSLGEPDKPTADCFECIHDLDRLERIYVRAKEADSWQDLLDTA